MTRWLGRLLVLVLAVSCVPSVPADGLLDVHQYESEGDVLVRSWGPSAEGHFQLTFSRRAGGIASWYDLDRDPSHSLNLAGRGDLPPVALLMHTLAPAVRRARQPEPSRGAGRRPSKVLYSAPAEKITVLESNVVRVRVHLEGVYSGVEVAVGFRGGSADEGSVRRRRERDPSNQFTTTYTVYPTGQLYVCHRIVRRATVLRVAGCQWVLATAPSTQFQVAGSPGGAEPRTLSDFVLHTSSGPQYHADVLLVPARANLPVSRWGERFLVGRDEMGAVRSALEMLPADAVIGAETHPWCCLLQIEPDWMDRADLAAIAAEAYQKPPLLRVRPGGGEVRRGDVGDDNLDGFSERQGCYTLRAARTGSRFSLDLSGSLLVTPVFHFSNWHGPSPRTLRVNGEEWRRGQQFEAVLLDQSTLLVQFYRNLKGRRVDVEVSTGRGLADPSTGAGAP